MVLKGLLKSATLVISSMLMAAQALWVPSRALKQCFMLHCWEGNGFTAVEEHARV